MAIDVDRDYIQSTALILQSIFYYVMLPTMLACIWEMTRHWYGLSYLPNPNEWCGLVVRPPLFVHGIIVVTISFILTILPGDHS